MNLATVPAINALSALTMLLNNGTLDMYSGGQPVSPETDVTSANTLLATFHFADPAFVSAQQQNSVEEQTASFQAASVSPSADGTVTFARASMAVTAWSSNTQYSVGHIVAVNHKLFSCIVLGVTSAQMSGPNLTSASIQDGSAYWRYLGPDNSYVVADFTVGSSATDIIVANTGLHTTHPVTITDFILTIPAS